MGKQSLSRRDTHFTLYIHDPLLIIKKERKCIFFKSVFSFVTSPCQITCERDIREIMEDRKCDDISGPYSTSAHLNSTKQRPLIQSFLFSIYQRTCSFSDLDGFRASSDGSVNRQLWKAACSVDLSLLQHMEVWAAVLLNTDESLLLSAQIYL